MAVRLVSTGAAARALSIDRRTLHRWAIAGLVQPDEITAGGHMRWDVERVRAHVRELAEARRLEADREP